MSKIFISHSSKDISLVKRLYKFIQLGMNMRSEEIFCSSLKGNLPTGKNFILTIQEKMKDCKAVIFLITEEYLKSQFCLAELGAAWALGHEIFPLLSPPITHNDIEKTPLLGMQCLYLDRREDILTLGTEFEQLRIAKLNLANFDNCVKQFMIESNYSKDLSASGNDKDCQTGDKLKKYIDSLSIKVKKDDKACFMLGTMYREGILVKQDKIKARELLFKAAVNHYPPAQRELSSMYYRGETGEQSFEEAFELALAAAKGDNPIAMDQLAFLYRAGLGCEKDLDKALEWYSNAAKGGCKSSYSCLGEIYSIRGDYPEAEKYYSKAVDSGYCYAALSLGMIYKEGGKNFPPDHVKAAYYFNIAAKAGITEAKYQLGQLYYMGYAVVRDFEAAVKWFKEAANEGDMRSQYNLGYAYHHGLGIKYDWNQAVYWYEKAAKRGHQLCQIDLADLCAQADKQEYEKAFHWYSKAADQNSSEAHRKLGDMYYFGLGCEANQLEAINHYKIAAEQKECVALFRLEEILSGKFRM